MSHNVLARTARSGDETVVEAITKVQSIDLVADPATTRGLYEHAAGRESRVESQGPDAPALDLALDSRLLTLDSLTLDQLREHRPDLVAELQEAYDTQLEQLRARLDEMAAEERVSRRRERIAQLLEHYELPNPAADVADRSGLVTPQFMETLLRAADDRAVERLIEQRAGLVRAACQWRNGRRGAASARPRSRQQLEFSFITGGKSPGNAAEFANSIRAR
jgi:hypothetical protein